MTDYTKLVPVTPPEGLLDWALQRIERLQRNIMVYKLIWAWDPMTGLRHREISGWCSACGQATTFDYYRGHETPGFFMYDGGAFGPTIIKNGDELYCPECGAKLTARHCGCFKNTYHLGSGWPMTVSRVEDKLVLTGWYIQREIWKNSGNYRVHTELRPYEAYVVEEKKLVRLKGYSRFMTAVTFLQGWQQVKRCDDEWGATTDFFPWDHKILEGSTAENSALDRYVQAAGQCRPVSYLRIWKQHKNVENLVVQGAGGLLNSIMEGSLYAQGYYGKAKVGVLQGINWKEARPAQMLGLNKVEFRQAVRLQLDRYGLKMLVRLKELGKPIRTDEDIMACVEFGPSGIINLAENGHPFLKIARYISKQIRKYPREKEQISASYLEDYWKMAQKAGDDLKDPDIRWPQHLTAAHDAVLLRVAWEEREDLKAKFKKVYRELEVLSFESDGIRIFPCPRQSDLTREGKVLHHCVGSYAETHAQGKHCIFFIRHADNPDIPWYTLELDVEKKQVLQNRGLRNCPEAKEVVAFKEKWLDHIRQRNERKISA